MKKKFLIISIVLITIINTILPVVNAATAITKASLIYDHAMDSHIMYYNKTKEEWRDIQCGYICYKIDGQKYPAYCITHGVNGVDEEGPYTVTIKELLKDKLVYNTIINGYPYKTAAQLGVETNDDAYVATKHAVNTVLLGRDVKSYYKAADKRGEKIIDAIYNISQKGKEGNAINEDAILSANKIGELKEKGDYYYQEYTVKADSNISKYSIESIENFSKKCYITDTNGNKKSEFKSNENFRVMIPKEDFYEDITGKINIIASCKTQPIFYGKAPKENVQNYAITYKPYVEYNKEILFSEKTNTSSIKVIKKDKETLETIRNVKFSLYNENNELLETKETDNSGIIIFKNLYPGKYKVKEIETNENYVKDDTIYEINTEYNKEIIKIISNTHKKGNLKIIKVDKDDNNIFLKGIEFELIDSSDNVVASLITDENGEAEAKNINIGKYTLKETKTKEEYNLCIDSNIEVKWNTTTEVKIENEKKKGQISIIKQDKENSDIKLEGVEFHIKDTNNRIVDKIKTNSKGEAISTKLPIGEYTVKEISLGENDRYILSENEYKVKVETDKIIQIVIENEHKKGNLKIKKVDKDNNDITLGAIEFDLINEKGEVIEHLITDVNGEAEIKDINIGTYTLKETKTKREYNLCENKNIIVEWNKISEVIVENEKKKGQVKVIKEDADINDIKLEGVKFQILDKHNKVIEDIETNEQGEALSSKLIIGEYKIKEISLGNNLNYILNDELYTVKIDDNKISEIKIQNTHKKGNLKIKKVDKDNVNKTLEGVEFEIIDKDNIKYIAKTNEKGIAEIKNIRIGNIEIKEISTNPEYVLPNKLFEKHIKYNETIEIVIENEKRKGQVEIYKTDKENSNIKIEGVEFKILDNNNQIIDVLKTDINGYAISKKIPIGNYYLEEVKTDDKYILNTGVLKIKIEENKVLNLNIKNEKAKGKIQIIKSSSNSSSILNINQGEYISGVTFEIFDENGKMVDSIITDEMGQCTSKDLVIGRYKVKEKSTNKYYVLNTNELFVNINKNGEIKVLDIKNDPIIPIVNIEKTCQQFAEKNEEIKYEFDIQNKSNSKLDNFTWKEYIPYEKSKITKIITGIYNKELEYEIYYKTNLNGYKLFKKVNSLESEYLTFENIKLSNKEKITEIKVEYKTVPSDFKSIVKPCIFVKVENDVRKGENITNITEIYGNVEEYVVKDKSSVETIIKETKILKKLPKTGC